MNIEAVRILVENGADVEYQNDEIDNTTAIIWACWGGEEEIVKYLIEKGANINYKDKNGNTALMHAANHYNLEAFETLLKFKADTKIKNNDGKTIVDMVKNNKLFNNVLKNF